MRLFIKVQTILSIVASSYIVYYMYTYISTGMGCMCAIDSLKHDSYDNVIYYNMNNNNNDNKNEWYGY